MKTRSLMLTISYLFMYVWTPSVWGQEKGYTTAMQSAIEMMEQASDPDQYMESANRFERIARAEKELWMPYYYSSYTLIVMSFDITDGTRKDQVLDRAQELLDRALELEPGESELHVLQAFLYPSRIMVDPMGRGMDLIGKMLTSLETARILNPENPRACFLEGVNKLNLPPSMGGGADIAKPILEEALSKFETFSKEDPLWPDWGEEATRVELEKLQ